MVTAEPHFLLHEATVRDAFPDAGLPVTVMSVEELERVVAWCARTGSTHLLATVLDQAPTGLQVEEVIQATVVGDIDELPNPVISRHCAALMAATGKSWPYPVDAGVGQVVRP